MKPHVARMYERREALLQKRYSVTPPALSKKDAAALERVTDDIAASEERDRVLRLEAMWTASGDYLEAVERFIAAPTDRRYDAVRAAAWRMRAIAQGGRRVRA